MEFHTGSRNSITFQNCFLTTRESKYHILLRERSAKFLQNLQLTRSILIEVGVTSENSFDTLDPQWKTREIYTSSFWETERALKCLNWTGNFSKHLAYHFYHLYLTESSFILTSCLVARTILHKKFPIHFLWPLTISLKRISLNL